MCKCVHATTINLGPPFLEVNHVVLTLDFLSSTMYKTKKKSWNFNLRYHKEEKLSATLILDKIKLAEFGTKILWIQKTAERSRLFTTVYALRTKKRNEQNSSETKRKENVLPNKECWCGKSFKNCSSKEKQKVEKRNKPKQQKTFFYFFVLCSLFVGTWNSVLTVWKKKDKCCLGLKESNWRK